MKIETFINNEAKKYKNKVIKNKKKGVDLDKLEAMSRKHINNCIEFIERRNVYNYSRECNYINLARKTIEEVDEQIFGCFNDKGQCLGFNFYGT